MILYVLVCADMKTQHVAETLLAKKQQFTLATQKVKMEQHSVIWVQKELQQYHMDNIGFQNVKCFVFFNFMYQCSSQKLYGTVLTTEGIIGR